MQNMTFPRSGAAMTSIQLCELINGDLPPLGSGDDASSTSIVEGGAHDVLLKDKTPYVSNAIR